MERLGSECIRLYDVRFPNNQLREKKSREELKAEIMEERCLLAQIAQDDLCRDDPAYNELGALIHHLTIRKILHKHSHGQV